TGVASRLASLQLAIHSWRGRALRAGMQQQRPAHSRGFCGMPLACSEDLSGPHQQIVTTSRLALVAAVLTIAAPQARAFHRTTPPVVPITPSGDDPLPRLPSLGDRLSISLGSQIFRFDRHLNVLDPITTTGDNANPTISSGGSVVAWDTDCDLI